MCVRKRPCIVPPEEKQISTVYMNHLVLIYLLRFAFFSKSLWLPIKNDPLVGKGKEKTKTFNSKIDRIQDQNRFLFITRIDFYLFIYV